MNLYVSCDMEGTAAVCSWHQCDPSNTYEYPTYRRYMTREVSAAIAGARSAGVTGVLINDSHWDAHNLLWDELPDDVRVISGVPKPLSMAQGLNAGFAGAFFTGYHAKIGDENGVLAHTYSPGAVYNVRINGVTCSEALINAAMAGYFGVPVLLLSGDRVIVEDVSRHLPWIAGVVVKEGVGHYATESLTPHAARELLYESAADAIRNASRAKPFTFDGPLTLEIDTVAVEQADFVELMPGFRRIAGRTIAFSHDDYRMIFRAFVAACRLAGAASVVA